jgi:hypothetical protein
METGPTRMCELLVGLPEANKVLEIGRCVRAVRVRCVIPTASMLNSLICRASDGEHDYFGRSRDGLFTYSVVVSPGRRYSPRNGWSAARHF